MAILLERAEEHPDWPMPGYTHLQRAQPVYLGHHLLAYFWMLARDRSRFAFAEHPGRLAAARRGRPRRRQLRHRPPRGGPRARLRRRLAELDRRSLQPRFRARLPRRRRHLRDAPLAARRRARAVVERRVRLLRAARRVELGLLDHAPEEEPRRRRAAAGEGPAGGRPPGCPARGHARPASDLQQGPAGGQGAPVRRRRHARAGARGGQRDGRGRRASAATGCARQPPTS